ncbi:hypothetical protein DPMN_081079 [Dreissena polymorpha]|uniref:Uncharacterized protein n=1 Tax=Dreissena polymorpha TaxID=45954 RepID=A0A9D4BFL8_DREPO|nr:hypothetical protein DPMN_081079 [Dreissena polymorpha]
MIGQKLKTAPPTGCHTNILTNFELGRDFIATKLLTKFHEDGTRNVASRVFTCKSHLSNQQYTNYFCQKWAKYCRIGHLMVGVHTNDGIERLHGTFKAQCLKGNSIMTLTSTVSVLVKKFLPKKYQSHVEENLKLTGTYQQYAPEIPQCQADGKTWGQLMKLAKYRNALSVANVADVNGDEYEMN